MIHIIIIILLILIIYLRYEKFEKYYNYVKDLSTNDNTINLFCKKLRSLDDPNEHNLLIKKFYKELINKNNKTIDRLNKEIDTIKSDMMNENIDKKKLYKLNTHNKTKKQLKAINYAINNLNSNNKIKVNLK